MAFDPLVAGWLVAASPVIGSFLGVLAWRLPEGRSPFFNRSSCPACLKALRAHELVPLLSYAVQGGRCRQCRAPIDPFHPAMEMAALLIATIVCVVFWLAPASDEQARRMVEGCIFGWWLLLLAAIDWRRFILPDYLTLPLMAAGLALAARQGGTNLAIHCLGALVAWLALTGVAMLYRKLRGRDGLGGGDAKLLAAGGAWLGPFILPHILFSGALVTLVFALVCRRGQLRGSLKLPFGPGLALALWGGWLFQTIGPVYD